MLIAPHRESRDHCPSAVDPGAGRAWSRLVRLHFEGGCVCRNGWVCSPERVGGMPINRPGFALLLSMSVTYVTNSGGELISVAVCTSMPMRPQTLNLVTGKMEIIKWL